LSNQLAKNPEWFDILELGYPGSPGNWPLKRVCVLWIFVDSDAPDVMPASCMSDSTACIQLSVKG